MIVTANPKQLYKEYESEFQLAISTVLNSGIYVHGDQCKQFEKEFSEYIGCEFGVGVANGTDALEIALKSVGIQKGDEVITVSHTAVATVAAIENVGAIPVLIDVNRDSYCMTGSVLQNAISSKTRAVIVVHIYGNTAEIDFISEICKENGVPLIEDVSQAHGAEYNGKKLGSFGDASCFSCYPTKNLGAFGDAGIIVTNSKNVAFKAKLLREYGWEERYISEISGRNSRLDELQAATLRVSLKYLDHSNHKRREIANLYMNELTDAVQKPFISENSKHVFHLFVILSKQRDELMAHLKQCNIIAGIHYPEPIHLQPAYSGKIKIYGEMTVTETISRQCLSLPIYPGLSLSDAKKVVNGVNSFFKE